MFMPLFGYFAIVNYIFNSYAFLENSPKKARALIG